MSDFKGRHFEGEIVLWAVRWYCRYCVSYRDLEQMMGERGVSVDTAYATIKGFKVMRALRKGQAGAFNITRDICGEARIVERAFGLGACPIAEAVQFLDKQLEFEAA